MTSITGTNVQPTTKDTSDVNLYEINIDGSGLQQITRGPWDDVEPCYLPDGGIAFCSSRCKRYVCCWYAPVAILFRCNADGSGLRMLSSDSTLASQTHCNVEPHEVRADNHLTSC
ncbi:MAG: TolB family protein [Thermoguttaceae bacterium]